MPSTKPRILLEMSGGLDSSCAAILLQKHGYEVVGVMMKLHDSSSFKSDLNSAKMIADKLNIQFKMIDYQKEFKKNVIDYFIETYKQAQTPNPCIICNNKMKFGLIFDIAEQLNCEKIATGHYAVIKHENATYSLHRAKDENKDQSYVLHFLNQDKLSKILFPLGKYTKEEMRALAKGACLPCADKPESMDICFVEDKNYSDFIQMHSSYKPMPGNVVDTSGNILGQHEGLINYTIGQRKGLGIAGGSPLYVLSLNKEKNEVVLGSKDETYTNEVDVANFSWISGTAPSETFKCQAKLRYRQKPRDCIAIVERKGIKLTYPDGIDSVTPGQFAVLYEKDKVLGGGTIKTHNISII